MAAPARHQTAYERNAPDPRVVTAALADSKQSVFWLEDADDQTRYPSLSADIRSELTIVGGGYLGLWTAVLAKRRNPATRVVLLEAQTLGWAASGRNGGFCEASLTHGESNGRDRWPDEYEQLEAMGLANLNAMGDDIRELGIKCHWELTGSLDVAIEEHEVSWLDAEGRLDQEQTRAEVNSPLYLASVWHKESCALVHPALLARELGRVAAELGVEIFENSPVIKVDTSGSSGVRVQTPRASVACDRVALATNVFPSLLRRNRLRTIPVYDYVLMTEPLSSQQMKSIGWANRQGISDLANQFHYSRLSRDNRILYGGYDAVYYPGRAVRPAYEQRPETFRKLAAHFLATYPQLEGLRFSHKWAGAIDTSTQFVAFHGLARKGRVAYAAGFTGLGVGATRFAAEVILDHLAGLRTAKTQLKMVRRKPLSFPPEPLASVGINATRWSLNQADHRQGWRNPFLRALDAVGLGFDS